MAMLKGRALLFLKHGIKMGLYVRQAEQQPQNGLMS